MEEEIKTQKEESKADTQKPVKKVSVKETKNHIMGTDKCSSVTFKGDAQKYTLIDEQEKGAMSTYFTCTTKKGEMAGVTFGVKSKDSDGKYVYTPETTLDQYDGAVHDAVVSLYASGNSFISLAMIYGAMTGKKNSEVKLTDEAKEKIVKSLWKLSSAWVSINNYAEADAYNQNVKCSARRVQRINRTAQCLYFSTETIYFENGTTSEGINVLEEPILYTYAKNIRQIQSDPMEIMNTPLYKNEENIILQRCLYQQINRIRSTAKKGFSNKILFETVLNELHITADYYSKSGTYRVKKKRTIDAMKKILDYWSGGEYKIISGYEITEDGFLIKLSRKEPKNVPNILL